MAEFKLGRIRFVWKNTWAGTGTTYIKDDVVRYGGKTYVCILGHVSTSNFYTDLTANWQLAADGQAWLGTWTASGTYYRVGDTVTYGGQVYICKTGHASQATLEADQSKWDLFASGFNWMDAWATATYYKVGDIVKYGATVYRCKTSHTSNADSQSATNGLEADQSKWDIVNRSFDYKGNWTVGTRYKVNDVVKEGAGLSICISANVSNGSSWAADTAYWDPFVQGLEFLSSYSTSTAYVPGDVVTYGGYSYVALTDNTNRVPTANPGDWSVLSTGFAFSGDWLIGTYYKVGNIVRLNGYTYLATSDNIGEKPPNVSYWQQLNPGYKWLGTWSVSTAYNLGDSVTAGSSSYVCVLANTGNNPTSDTLGTYWNQLSGGAETAVMTTQGDLTYYSGSGPSRLPIGSDGQVLTVSGSNLVWNTFGDIPNIYYVAPTGTDTTDNNQGKTLDKPWLTIKYACSQATSGSTIFVKTGTYTEICPISVPAGVALVGDELRSTAVQPTVATANMFYVRNGSGIRNMTLQGLNGTLGSVNSYGTKRPTAGAYVSLDPGVGPSDTSVHITTRSPYIQNVTTLGTGCIGMKVDGALHNAGNKSIVANDFTQVLSDGIGVWVTNNARSELVSVFTYYNHIGYLSENGGKIRATNGNNSYGEFGSVSEFVDSTETPITATVNNRSLQAQVGNTFTSGSSIYRLEYSNAGNAYPNSGTSFTFNSVSGINAVAIGDEVRDNAVFENRMLTSGTGYVNATNTAQNGTSTTIVIAQADTAISAAYLGMRIVITAGLGVGQQAYITYYSSGTKTAIVAKESFVAVTASQVTATGALITVPSTTSFYVNMPISFTGTAIGGFNTSTVYYVQSVVSSTQIAISATSGGAVISSGLSDVTASTMIINAAGWDHAVVGTTIQSLLDATTAYSIEPRVTYTAPSYATTSRTVTSGTWSSSTYANGRFVAVANSSGTSAYSLDGINWTAMTGLASAPFVSVASGAISTTTYYVAVASGASSTTAYVSSNGTSWSAMTSLASANWSAVAYGNGRFVAISNGTATSVSTNGSSWTAGGTLVSQYWTSIAYGAGPAKFVAISGGTSQSTAAAYSTDGTSWISSTLPQNAYWTGVSWGNGRFVAVAQGGQQTAYSLDGITWTTPATILPSSQAWKNISYGQGTFLATSSILNPVVTGTSIGSNQISLDSSGGTSVGQNWVPTTVTQTTTASATSTAVATLSSNSIIGIPNALNVLSPGMANQGTFANGMVLSGPGVQTAQALTISSLVGNGSLLTITYATQSAVPFVAGQTIRLQGVTPITYNRSYVVSGTPTTSQVQLVSTLQTPYVSGGTIFSNPLYITGSNTFVSTGSSLSGTTLTIGTVSSGTVAPGMSLTGNTFTSLNSNIIGTTLSLAGTVTGTPAVGMYIGAPNVSVTPTITASNTNSISISNVTLGTTVTFTASISPVSTTNAGLGSVMTVTTTPTGSGIVLGYVLSGTGVTKGTYVVSNLTGTGASAASTWSVNLSQTVASTTITATPVLFNVSGSSGPGTIVQGAVVTGNANLAIGQNITITNIVGDTTQATVTFSSTQSPAPFTTNQSITITGNSVAAFNGTFNVIACTTTFVRFETTSGDTGTGGSVSSAGTIVTGQIFGASGASVVSTVSTGAIGSNILVVTSNTSIAVGQLLSGNGAAISGIQPSTYVTNINGLNITVSLPFTAAISTTVHFYVAGGAGQYLITPTPTTLPGVAILTTQAYTLSASNTSYQNNSIVGNSLTGYITGNISGSGNGSTWAVSTAFGATGSIPVNGLSYTLSSNQTVPATVITGTNNLVTIGSTTGMVVGESITFAGGTTARTPTIAVTTSSGNLITLNSTTNVVTGNVIIPTAVTQTPNIIGTASGSNQILLSSATGVLQGSSIIPTAVTRSTTATATTNAVASMSSSTISSSGLLTATTLVSGTITPGMLLTGSGIQTAQNIAITAASGNSTTVTLTYATQSSIPFVVGQTITVQGMTPNAYNGTWIVNGSPSTTQVTFLSTASGSLTTTGTIISDPCYIVSNVSGSGNGSTWQTNLSSMVAVSSTTITGTNNLITVASTTGITAGQPIIFTGVSLGNIISGTTYFVTQVVPVTNEISIGANYGSTNFVVTTATGTMTAVVGSQFGNLTSGTTYYVASITGAYATLSTSPTLTPVLTLVNSGGSWASITNSILGGERVTIRSTGANGNLVQLSNTANITVGQAITATATTQELTFGTTLGATTASLATSTISTAGLLTIGTATGTVYPGMVLTGTGVQIAQNYTITEVASANGTSVTLSFSTGTAPIVGQLITIQGMVPVGYNGTYAVTGATAGSVSYSNSTVGPMTSAGVMLSEPAYIVSNVNGINGTGGTWQVNYTTGAAVGSTTITGTANLATVNSVSGLVIGEQFTTPATGTFGGINTNTAYFITGIVPSTNQIMFSTSYYGANQAFTSGVTVGTSGATFAATAGTTFGGLTTNTTYYVARVFGNYVTLATTPTLATIVTLTNGSNNWATGIDSLIGIISGKPYYIASVDSPNITVSTSPTLSPIVQMTNGVGAWTTAVYDTTLGGLMTTSTAPQYFISEVVSATQVAITFPYGSANAPLATSTVGTPTVTAGSYLGGLTSGTTYYIASINSSTDQITVSTSSTLSPVFTITGYSAGAWTSVTGSGSAASSPDGINWTPRAVSNLAWTALTFGNTNTSFAGSITGTTLTVTNSPTGSGIVLGAVLNGIGIIAGTTVTANLTGSQFSSSSTWTVSTDHTASPTGSITVTSGAPIWTMIATGGTTALSIPNFTQTQARAVVTSGQISGFRIYEPGSGYTTPPTITLGDPNATVAATYTVRNGIGVLGNPSFANRGTNYVTATTTIAGTGYADIYQNSQYMVVSNLTSIPTPGSNIQFAGNATYYKLVIVSGQTGSPGNYSAVFQISPPMSIALAPAHGVVLTMRILYSQVRLTGHDFLSIGTGNITNTNYPGIPIIQADQTKQITEGGGGRVFYTSTDQDGNFNVGNLFTVQQSTGIATLNANAFNLSGLQTLTLGAVTLGSSNTSISAFSTDGTFTANSDSIVPTQKAIRTYITSQIGGGGSTVNINTLVAGNVQISGDNLTNTANIAINIKSKANFTQGIDGSPLALNYYMI
jgi:hypothetical protein